MKKVLLIDDERELVDLAEVDFDSWGWACVKCTSGNEAIETLKQESFDLIVSDLLMPDGDGKKVLEHRNKNCPETKFVVVSAFVKNEQELKGNGVDFILKKPIDSEELKPFLDSLK